MRSEQCLGWLGKEIFTEQLVHEDFAVTSEQHRLDYRVPLDLQSQR